MLRMASTLADIVPIRRLAAVLPAKAASLRRKKRSQGGAEEHAQGPRQRGKLATEEWAGVLFRLTKSVVSGFCYRYRSGYWERRGVQRGYRPRSQFQASRTP
jgi:hypothetical protein